MNSFLLTFSQSNWKNSWKLDRNKLYLIYWNIKTLIWRTKTYYLRMEQRGRFLFNSWDQKDFAKWWITHSSTFASIHLLIHVYKTLGSILNLLLYRWLSVFIAQKLKDISSYHLNTWSNGWVSISVREMEMFLIRIQEPATVRNCNCTSETQNKEKCHFSRWILSF